MSDPNDNNAPDAASRIDELVSAIRTALVSDASSEARAGGASAARAILRGLEPSPARNGPPPGASAAAGNALGVALGALSSIPREQVLEFVISGVRALLGPGAPAYRTAPLRRPFDSPEGS